MSALAVRWGGVPCHHRVMRESGLLALFSAKTTERERRSGVSGGRDTI